VETTTECIRRGGFGSPTMFVGEHMYFGNDRLPLVERRLALQEGWSGSGSLAIGGDGVSSASNTADSRHDDGGGREGGRVTINRNRSGDAGTLTATTVFGNLMPKL
jgi:hypothetical protein